MKTSTAEFTRLLSRSHIRSCSCISWAGHVEYLNSSGCQIPMVMMGDEGIDATTMSWQVFVGDVSPGTEVTHVCPDGEDCKFGDCVNPLHLSLTPVLWPREAYGLKISQPDRKFIGVLSAFDITEGWLEFEYLADDKGNWVEFRDYRRIHFNDDRMIKDSQARLSEVVVVPVRQDGSTQKWILAGKMERPSSAA